MPLERLKATFGRSFSWLAGQNKSSLDIALLELQSLTVTSLGVVAANTDIAVAQMAAPTGVAATLNAGGGYFPNGLATSFKVSAVNAFGNETTSSTAGTVTTTAVNQSININWNAVVGAIGYNLYGRVSGQERLIAKLGPVTSYFDNGVQATVNSFPDGNTTSPALPVALWLPTGLTPVDGGVATPGLAAAATYYRVSALTNYGETVPCTEATVTPTAGHGINVVFNAVQGATGYNIYGRATGAEQLLATLQFNNYEYNAQNPTGVTGGLSTAIPVTTTVIRADTGAQTIVAGNMTVAGVVTWLDTGLYSLGLKTAASVTVNTTQNPAFVQLAAPTTLAGAVPPATTQSTAASGTLTSGATYRYLVTAINAAGETTVSNELSYAVPAWSSPAQPGQGAVTLTWALVTNATGYKVYRSAAGGAANSETFLASVAGGTNATYTDTNALQQQELPFGARNTIVFPTVNTTGIQTRDTILSCMQIGATGLLTDITSTMSIGTGSPGAIGTVRSTAGITNGALLMWYRKPLYSR